jgi:DNA-binding transcriptional LysR family regulator
MDQLRALRVFVRVADEGSFAKAARELDLAAAVVTRLVADLEQTLGARLIHRTTRRLSLTPVGLQYLERARQILADLDEADALASSNSMQLRGLLRIAGPLPLLQLQIAPLLPEFRQRYPGIELHFTVVPTLEAPDDNADLTLLLRGPRPLDGDFVVRRLARAEVLLCATPAYLQQHGAPRHPAELAQHELLVPQAPGAAREWQLQPRDGGEAKQLVGAPHRGSLLSDSPALLLAAAKAGMGIAGTLSYLVADDLRAGSLQRVLPDWCAGFFTIYVAMPTRKFLPQRARAFSDFLVEKFGGEESDPWAP